MAIAICTYCGGLVLMRSTMCPHCGQRGEATPTSGRKVSTFGAKKGLPLVVRRLIVCAIAGFGAVVCLALANWVRPAEQHALDETASQCDEIRDTGEEEPGELNACEVKLARQRALER
jgi:hypothetical protein